MEITKDESFIRMLKSYLTARASWEVYCFIERIDDTVIISTDRRQVNSTSLMYQLRRLAYKDIFIELYKVLHSSTKASPDNIHKVLRIAKQDQNLLASVEMANKKLKAMESEISYVCDLRNKVYGHLAPDYKDALLRRIGIAELNNCFHLVEECIIAITSKEFMIDALKPIQSRHDFKIEFSEK